MTFLGNKKFHSRNIFHIFMLSLLLTGLFTVSGCSEYRTFNYKTQQGIRFSFEYPTRFGRPITGRDSKLGITDARFHGNRDFSFLLTVLPNDGDTALSILERDLSHFSQSNDFQLLERSQIAISGIVADYFLYSWLMVSEFVSADEERISIPRIERYLYFTYYDLTWIMRMGSNMDCYDEANLYFERVLQTFTIKD